MTSFELHDFTTQNIRIQSTSLLVKDLVSFLERSHLFLAASDALLVAHMDLKADRLQVLLVLEGLVQFTLGGLQILLGVLLLELGLIFPEAGLELEVVLGLLGA